MENGRIGNLIFLSYRRADTAAQTLALKLELENNLRAVQVFMDNGSISAGDKFPDQINNALDEASLVIAVIGKSWVGAVAENGTRRLDDPDDWVFREVFYSLQNKSGAFLPIFIDDTPSLAKEELPEKLKDLANLQALRITTVNWDSSITYLLNFLQKKYQFLMKQDKYEYPVPDEFKAKTIPYPWRDLQTDLKNALPMWMLEFSDDPERLFYKRLYLRRDFTFSSYKKTIEFVNLIAQHSIDEDHHPQFLVLWRTVTVWTSTWDAGHRITSYDVAFAKYLERNFKSKFSSK